MSSGGPALSRRGFLAAGAVSAGCVAVGGGGVLARQVDAVYVRPPGCAGEDDLVARCDRCQRCVQACPYSIVHALPLTENFIAHSTPTLDFKTGYCDYCMKCVDACPTGALRYGVPSERNLGVAKVISDVCVAWAWTGCTVCKDVCPVEGAITMDAHGRPVIDEGLCDGCGLCEKECPSASLRSYEASALPRGVYVVPRESAAAATPGAITAQAYVEGARVRARGGREGGLQTQGGGHE